MLGWELIEVMQRQAKEMAFTRKAIKLGLDPSAADSSAKINLSKEEIEKEGEILLRNLQMDMIPAYIFSCIIIALVFASPTVSNFLFPNLNSTIRDILLNINFLFIFCNIVLGWICWKVKMQFMAEWGVLEIISAYAITLAIYFQLSGKYSISVVGAQMITEMGAIYILVRGFENLDKGGGLAGISYKFRSKLKGRTVDSETDALDKIEIDRYLWRKALEHRSENRNCTSLRPWKAVVRRKRYRRSDIAP